MTKYVIYKRATKKIWKKRNLWIVYSDTDGVYNSGWAWTYTGAKNAAELYINKIENGSYFK